MQKEAALQKINDVIWHHKIDLGNDIVTPCVHPGDTRDIFETLGLPIDMRGMSVVDIGAWDGYYSFACEKRGADVLATDYFCWGGSGFIFKTGFDIAKAALGSNVSERFIKVEDISPETLGGYFDISLFLGVLYHAPDPLGYLKRVRSVTRKFAVIETHVDLLNIETPALAYYPGKTLNGDPTNFFGPNPAAVKGMCEDAGFSRTEIIDASRPTRMVFHAFV